MRQLLELQFDGFRKRDPDGAERRTSGLSSPPGEQATPIGNTNGGAVAATNAAGGAELGQREESAPTAMGAGRTVWAIDCLLEPVAVRFRFHFEEDRPTNRVDREHACSFELFDSSGVVQAKSCLFFCCGIVACARCMA